MVLITEFEEDTVIFSMSFNELWSPDVSLI